MMAELGEVRTADFAVYDLAWGREGPHEESSGRAGMPERPGESEALWGSDSSFHQPSSNACPFLLLCSTLLSSPAVLLAAYQACPALPFKPVFPSVTFSDHSSSLSSLSLGLCYTLVYIMHLRTWVVTLCLLWRPFSVKAFAARQMNSNYGSTTW